MSNPPDDTFAPFEQALAARSSEFTDVIERDLSQSQTIFAQLPAEQRRSIAIGLVNGLQDALATGSPGMLRALLSDPQLPADRPFADTQALFARARRALLNLLRPEISERPEAGVLLVDLLGELLGSVREAEVERQIQSAARRAEEQAAELRVALCRLEQGFLTTPLATLEADTNGNITRWNPAAERIFGWSAEEAIGRNAIELLVPGLAREHVEYVVGALLSGQATNSRNQNIRKDGQIITCQWHNAVLRDHTGAVSGWLSQTQDVSEELRAAQQLQQSESYLRAIFNAMSDIVLVIDRAGVYQDVAPTNPQLLQRDADQVIGKHMADVLPAHRAGEFSVLISAVLDDGVTRSITYHLETEIGNRWFNATVSRLAEDRVLWVARDITEQHTAEQERLHLQEQVIAAQQVALREISTPIIPISDGIVAMPLIGSIDSSRAQQMIEALLVGVSERQTGTAILDITGVPVVDTQVANVLLRAAQAVKLLGAQVILTGIRPEVAQTLVGLGLDLSGIITLATLQSGIAFALRRR